MVQYLVLIFKIIRTVYSVATKMNATEVESSSIVRFESYLHQWLLTHQFVTII